MREKRSYLLAMERKGRAEGSMQAPPNYIVSL